MILAGDGAYYSVTEQHSLIYRIYLVEPPGINEDLADTAEKPAREMKSVHQTAVNGKDASLPTELVDRLQSANSADRAAALADLADINSDHSFDLITRSFDDPAVEVRNAAARALYHLSPDLSASSFMTAVCVCSRSTVSQTRFFRSA